MYILYGFKTQNSLKTLYVAESLGVDYEFRFVDLFKAESRSPEFVAKNPMGKVPVLEHDGRFLFESGAICRYLANEAGSELYPRPTWERALVDQWLDWFTCHLGWQLNQLYFQLLIKPAAGLGATDEPACETARKFSSQQLAVLESELAKRSWLCGAAMSIADLAALAYIEQAPQVNINLKQYPNVNSWFRTLEALPASERVRARFQAG